MKKSDVFCGTKEKFSMLDNYGYNVYKVNSRITRDDNTSGGQINILACNLKLII